uniref:Protein kinase domain-containing protein n=1 Tax=Labrus bergylta TaxID=56723 RepID=A0A3Q3EEG6_9LABR
MQSYEAHLVGNGAFAKVAKCVKSATKEMVALRVVKIHTKSDLQREHEILLKLRYFNPDECNFVKWHCSFMYKRHLCQEFELLDMSLREFVTMRPTRSLHLKEIKTILYQLATTLEVLKRLQVAHCDLKLENIMLVDHVRQPLRVKVIDFGSACNASNIAHGAYIQTRWYRAPETILGLPCSEAIDMWSLGCIAAELFLGHPLYPGSCEYQMLQFMIQTQGQLPDRHLSKTDAVVDEADLENFVELVKQMLHLDSTKRITPSQEDESNPVHTQPQETKKRVRDDILLKHPSEVQNVNVDVCLSVPAQTKRNKYN